jgi:hypothetical protein
VCRNTTCRGVSERSEVYVPRQEKLTKITRLRAFANYHRKMPALLLNGELLRYIEISVVIHTKHSNFADLNFAITRPHEVS